MMNKRYCHFTILLLIKALRPHNSFFINYLGTQYPSHPLTTTFETIMHLQLSTVLSLLSLAIALPHPGYPVPSSPHLKRQYCPTTNTTTTQPWTLSEFRTFTADPGPDGISYVSFYFLDPNDGGLNQCGKPMNSYYAGEVLGLWDKP